MSRPTRFVERHTGGSRRCRGGGSTAGEVEERGGEGLVLTQIGTPTIVFRQREGEERGGGGEVEANPNRPPTYFSVRRTAKSGGRDRR